MKLVIANGKEYLQMTKIEWAKMGKDNGWISAEAKKKGKKVNPWAVCTKSVGREDNDKYERCVLDVKKEHPIKKD